MTYRVCFWHLTTSFGVFLPKKTLFYNKCPNLSGGESSPPLLFESFQRLEESNHLKLFSLLQRECKITYSSPAKTGFYAAAVMIEDFATPTATEALSSIPLQFLIYFFNSNEACDERPEFTEETRAEGTCIGIPPGGTYFDQIMVRAGGPSKRYC